MQQLAVRNARLVLTTSYFNSPARKTVTRTRIIRRTKTIKRTKVVVRTSTFVPNTLSAVVFLDTSGDETFRPGDVPLAGVQVDLVIIASVSRRKDRAEPLCIFLGTAITNVAGSVTFDFGVVPPNSNLCISRHQSCFPCLASIQAGPDGRVPKNTSVEAPIPVSTTTAPALATTTAPALATTLPGQASTQPAQATTAPARATTAPAQDTTTSAATVTATATVAVGSELYQFPRTTKWTAPEGVSEVHVACLGGGAGGGWAGLSSVRKLGKREDVFWRARGGGGGQCRLRTGLSQLDIE